MSEPARGESSPADDEPAPRLPRGRGLKLDNAMIFRIVATLALLVMIVVTARPCAEATSKFVTDFGEAGSGKAGSAIIPTEPRLEDYEVLRPNMTEAEQKAVIERARQKAAAQSGAGSASGSGATAPASGSASGSGATVPASGSASGSAAGSAH